MVKTEWLENINNKFYAFSDVPKENTITQEYTSGRVVSFQRNTKKVMTFSCKIKLSVDTELPLFWAWFNDVLGQTSGYFKCSAFGTRYYRFVSVPTPEDTDRQYRTLSLEIEEAV